MLLRVTSRSVQNYRYNASVAVANFSYLKNVRFNSTKPTPPNKTPVSVSAPVVKSDAKPTLWEKVKHEAKHYWDGTKLLGWEIKISSRLLLKMTAGYELTRREYRQLQRTTTDVLRVIPFAFFIIVPFAELLLPIALKIFPGLLPSTFESKMDKDKKLQLLRNTRYKVADVLKNSKDMFNVNPNITPEQTADFNDFMLKLRSPQAAEISNDQLFRVAKLFKDDLILDNAPRGILIAMAKYINLRPFGTDQILRYRIRHKMLKLKEDDRLIDYEGVNALSTVELQQACASRGIHIFSATTDQMKKWLKTWLDLRLREHVPSTIMLLTNAHMYGETEIYSSPTEALKAVLSSLPVEFYHEQSLHVDKDATPQQRLEVLKEQEHLIQSENVQEAGHEVLVKDKLSLDDPKPSESESENKEKK